ncbi:MAG: hypothetical protein JWP12_3255 [Bacteroidetes bacterium]|nr:hypothetical protein [Bacteroidota bacterium]
MATIFVSLKYMKQLHFFIAFLFLSLCANAQPDTAKLIGLHPAVGKIISHNEKIKYRLFPEYSDNTFTSAQVFMYNDTTYLLKITQTDGNTLKDTIRTYQMDDFYTRIEDVEKGKIKDPEYAITTQEKQDTYEKHMSAPDVNQKIGTVLLTTLQVLYTLSLFMPR